MKVILDCDNTMGVRKAMDDAPDILRIHVNGMWKYWDYLYTLTIMSMWWL